MRSDLVLDLCGVVGREETNYEQENFVFFNFEDEWGRENLIFLLFFFCFGWKMGSSTKALFIFGLLRFCHFGRFLLLSLSRSTVIWLLYLLFTLLPLLSLFNSFFFLIPGMHSCSACIYNGVMLDCLMINASPQAHFLLFSFVGETNMPSY